MSKDESKTSAPRFPRTRAPRREQVEKPKPAQHYDMSRLNVELD